ncbi:hypothetical protein [Vibrio owensii]|uniref:hypothetical protein n=1 Tax=Vibrio harveyi group TaxID=717610 RepID=UPI003CC63522
MSQLVLGIDFDKPDAAESFNGVMRSDPDRLVCSGDSGFQEAHKFARMANLMGVPVVLVFDKADAPEETRWKN